MDFIQQYNATLKKRKKNKTKPISQFNRFWFQRQLRNPQSAPVSTPSAISSDFRSINPGIESLSHVALCSPCVFM